jgi:uncharacterized protein (TIGR02453 family)
MLQQHVIPFLTALAANNNKPWFDKNKALYDKALTDFSNFINELLEQMAETDPALKGLTAKEVVYRIYRDVRFSNDKTPYKTHLAASIAPGGRKSANAAFYVHIEPTGTSICGGGMYQPSPALLKAIRSEFYQVPDEVLEILHQPQFKKYFSGFWGEALKTAPKGFDKDFEHINLLKYKHFVVINDIPSKTVASPQLSQYIIEAHKAIFPLNRLLNTIASDAGLL